jgi:hypothetical protein
MSYTITNSRSWDGVPNSSWGGRRGPCEGQQGQISRHVFEENNKLQNNEEMPPAYILKHTKQHYVCDTQKKDKKSGLA